MSGNARQKPLDRRILQTREALGDALIELMQQKPFDELTVQQVLDRAGVGRSTFYAHYRDKEDLFLSDVEDFLDALGSMLTRAGAPTSRIAPVRELFAHIADVPRIGEAIVASGKWAAFLELARGHFSRSIEARLLLAGVSLPAPELKACACALSASLLALLEWWREHGMQPGPAEMDALFHRLAWNGLGLEC